MLVRVKRLHGDAVIPQYAHRGDAGFDLVAVEDVIIEPGQTVKVSTGLAFEIPFGYEMQIRPRSGVTSKTKIRVQLGTVDSGYRGEVSVIIDNIAAIKHIFDPDTYDLDPITDSVVTEISGKHVRTDRLFEFHPVETYIIRKGDRIAQAVIAPVTQALFSVVDELNDTERGDGGFGSSGV